MKKILISYPFFHRFGGIERYLAELISQLSQKQAHYNIAYNQYELSEKIPDDAIYVPIFKKLKSLYSFLFAVMSMKVINTSNYIVHTHGTNSLSFDFITAHSCHKAWYIESLRALKPLSRPWLLKLLNPIHYVTILMETWQYKISTFEKVIAVSGIVKDQLLNHYGIDEEKIVTLHSGVNTQEFTPVSQNEKNKLRASLRLPDDKKVLLFVSNEFKRKNLELVINVLADLPPHFFLAVVGKDDPTSYRKQAEDLGLDESRILFLGLQKNLGPYYQSSDLFVLPTKHDAFALVALEAMSCGIPCVTTRQAGVSEIIDHGFDSYIMEDCNSFEDLKQGIEDTMRSDTYEAMATHARKKAEMYDWGIVTEKMLAIYQTSAKWDQNPNLN